MLTDSSADDKDIREIRDTPGKRPASRRQVDVALNQDRLVAALEHVPRKPCRRLKYIAYPVNAVQICSILYKRDPSVIGEITRGLAAWMDARGFENLDAFRGRMSVTDLKDKHGFERAQYVKSLVGLE